MNYPLIIGLVGGVILATALSQLVSPLMKEARVKVSGLLLIGMTFLGCLVIFALEILGKSF